MRVLVVTAVDAERDAIDLPDVVAGGIGPAESAAATSAALASGSYDLVISAGIAGGFAPLPVGAIAVASTIAFADLGTQSDAGFAPLPSAVAQYEVGPKLAVELADRTGGHLGTIVTVSTVTGTQHGSLFLAGDGSFTYTPSSGTSTNDSFTYLCTQRDGASATATVSITINP